MKESFKKNQAPEISIKNYINGIMSNTSSNEEKFQDPKSYIELVNAIMKFLAHNYTSETHSNFPAIIPAAVKVDVGPTSSVVATLDYEANVLNVAIPKLAFEAEAELALRKVEAAEYFYSLAHKSTIQLALLLATSLPQDLAKKILEKYKRK